MPRMPRKATTKKATGTRGSTGAKGKETTAPRGRAAPGGARRSSAAAPQRSEAPAEGEPPGALALGAAPAADVARAADDAADGGWALAALAKAVGPAAPGLLEALLAGTSEATLVEEGRRIDTGRVVKDASRLYGEAHDFWRRASAAQRRRLRGFSPELLALAVHQALELERLHERHRGESGAEAAERARVDTDSQVAFSEGRALRDQAATALRDAAGRHATRRAEVDGAVGTAEDAESLARGLANLATLLARWLATPSDPLARRLALASLDADYVAELREASARVRATAAASRRRPARARVSRGALDRADGLNLLLLGQVMRAFDRAHALDPTIPRLVPIATRHMFNRNTPSKKPAAGPTPPA